MIGEETINASIQVCRDLGGEAAVTGWIIADPQVTGQELVFGAEGVGMHEQASCMRRFH